MTKDPQNNTISRWKEDGKLHVFMDAFETSAKFKQWFQDEILRNGNCMNSDHWDVLLKRYRRFRILCYMLQTNLLKVAGILKQVKSDPSEF